MQKGKGLYTRKAKISRRDSFLVCPASSLRPRIMRRTYLPKGAVVSLISKQQQLRRNFRQHRIKIVDITYACNMRMRIL